jgi:hypothetical protein
MVILPASTNGKGCKTNLTPSRTQPRRNNPSTRSTSAGHFAGADADGAEDGH